MIAGRFWVVFSSYWAIGWCTGVRYVLYMIGLKIVWIIFRWCFFCYWRELPLYSRKLRTVMLFDNVVVSISVIDLLIVVNCSIVYFLWILWKFSANFSIHWRSLNDSEYRSFFEHLVEVLVYGTSCILLCWILFGLFFYWCFVMLFIDFFFVFR